MPHYLGFHSSLTTVHLFMYFLLIKETVIEDLLCESILQNLETTMTCSHLLLHGGLLRQVGTGDYNAIDKKLRKPVCFK